MARSQRPHTLPFLELGPFHGEEWMVIKPHVSLLVVCGSNQREPRGFRASNRSPAPNMAVVLIVMQP